MPRERLTLFRIAAFNPTGEGFLWDTEMPRLAVRARPSGARSFIFKGSLSGKEIRVTIGSTDAWTIEAARERAREFQRWIDDGRDPREVLRERETARLAEIAAAEAAAQAARDEAERRERYTLGALCDAYVAHLERSGKGKSADDTRSSFKCHVIEAHPKIAALPARDITPHQVAAMVRKVRDAGKERAAGVLRSYLSAAFNAAQRAPFDSALPSDLIPFAIEHSPVDAIPAIPVKRGERTLSAAELRAYLAALGDDLADKALRLALLAGGQRMAQLLRAKVSDYDVDTATLRLWDGKGKRQSAHEHLLSLAPKGAALVEELIERARKRERDRAKAAGEEPRDVGGMWLFSSYGKTQMVNTTPGVRAAEISVGMKGEAFDLRDIRRTCETMLAGLGISKDTRAQLLSHGISGVQAAHYDRHGYTDEKRAALVAWERKLDEIEKGKKPAGNVRQLRHAS
ncbi:MAG: integrase family protein [Aromatoleum sp.]|jgi:integrase|uniref:tyrosine-type recombinase/integrase n=1 Tax=Aromatoleum sp. TaxID=2307007 RepID=UPI002895BA05|nr:integrase family protein [Aromatoleum sp.]MDT3668939.1 integrase family protein [Aromatoleum sp.]